MSVSTTDRMSSDEKRAGISLAAVFALRMLGLFLILPVFAIYAKELPSGMSRMTTRLRMPGNARSS